MGTIKKLFNQIGPRTINDKVNSAISNAAPRGKLGRTIQAVVGRKPAPAEPVAKSGSPLGRLAKTVQQKKNTPSPVGAIGGLAGVKKTPPKSGSLGSVAARAARAQAKVAGKGIPTGGLFKRKKGM